MDEGYLLTTSFAEQLYEQVKHLPLIDFTIICPSRIYSKTGSLKAFMIYGWLLILTSIG